MDNLMLTEKKTSFYSVITDYFWQSEDSHSGPSSTTHTPLWSTIHTIFYCYQEPWQGGFSDFTPDLTALACFSSHPAWEFYSSDN